MLQPRIQTFLEVANCLSFSTAAQNLHISQQAVTRQIAALEQELGLRLFYRTTRQVALTPAGSFLRDSFTQLNRQVGDSIRRARELDSSGKALLRVGFLSALSRKDIILPITEFLMRQHPQLELDIRLLDFVALRNSLLDNQLELCVTTSNDWAVLARNSNSCTSAQAVSGGIFQTASSGPEPGASVGNTGTVYTVDTSKR